MTEHEVNSWQSLMAEQLSPCGDPVSVSTCASGNDKCSACVTAAAYLARLVMEGYEPQVIGEHYRNRFAPKKGASPSIDDAPLRGPPMAPVTIVEFSDFQCPHCGRAHPILNRALAASSGRVKMVFKHYPLAGHPRAMPAAQAAEAARLQGKFWEMHDQLFEHQGQLEAADLTRYATEIGLDVPKFEADMVSEQVDRRIQANRAEGQALGVDATPTIYVNGRKLQESPAALEAYLREELEL